MSKSLYSTSFNTKFIELITKLTVLFPDNDTIGIALSSYISAKKINPTIAIKLWHQYVSKYYDIIYSGNINYFLDKDFTEDVSNLDQKTAKQVLTMIDDSVRTPMKSLCGTDLNICTEFVISLCKLAEKYDSMN